MLENTSELARLRKERRLTQREVAAVVGVTDQTISNLERGESRPDVDLALALARFFDLPVEALFAPETSTQDVEAAGTENGPATLSAPPSQPVASMSGDRTGENGGAGK